MAKTPQKTSVNESVSLVPETYEAGAFYDVQFARVVDLGDMKLRPAHSYPSVAGELLASLPADAISSAKKLPTR